MSAPTIISTAAAIAPISMNEKPKSQMSAPMPDLGDALGAASRRLERRLDAAATG